jgi:hypothetical protein
VNVCKNVDRNDERYEHEPYLRGVAMLIFH